MAHLREDRLSLLNHEEAVTVALLLSPGGGGARTDTHAKQLRARGGARRGALDRALDDVLVLRRDGEGLRAALETAAGASAKAQGAAAQAAQQAQLLAALGERDAKLEASIGRPRDDDVFVRTVRLEHCASTDDVSRTKVHRMKHCTRVGESRFVCPPPPRRRSSSLPPGRRSSLPPPRRLSSLPPRRLSSLPPRRRSSLPPSLLEAMVVSKVAGRVPLDAHQVRREVPSARPCVGSGAGGPAEERFFRPARVWVLTLAGLQKKGSFVPPLRHTSDSTHLRVLSRQYT